MAELLSLPIPKERNLYFYDYVQDESVRKLTEDIISINESDRLLEKLYDVYDLKYVPKPIKIYIDSFGGSVYDVLGLVSIIETSITPIYTYATGAAMSCGLIILISGHYRFCYKYSTPLYHQVSSWAVGNLEDLKLKIAETKRIQKILESIIIAKTNLTKSKLREINSKKLDWYMSPKEAMDWGIVDEII